MDSTETKKTPKDFFEKVKEYIVDARVELIIAVAVFLFDMLTKWLVSIYLPNVGDTVTVIPFFLAFTNVHNNAAAFGNSFGLDSLLGDVGTRVVLCIFQFAAVIVFAIFMYKLRKKHIVIRITLALLIAGALGNAIDRAVFGYVRDFVEIIYFGLTIAGQKSFYIWNIADAALIIGLVMAIISVIFFYKEDAKEIPETVVDESGDVVSGILPDTVGMETAEAASKTEAKPEPDPKANAEADIASETEAKPEPNPKANAEADVASKTEAKPEPDPKSNAKADVASETEAKPEPDPKANATSGGKNKTERKS